MESNRSWHWKTTTVSSLSENMPVDPTLPDKDVMASLKRIRIHPEAQRILGNSHVPIVCLERLTIRTAPNRPVFLQPVVPLVRLPCLTLSENQDVCSEDHGHQNGSYQNKEDITEVTEMASPTKPGSPLSPEQSEIIACHYNECWTQPYSSGSSHSIAEQDFYCDPDYIQIEPGKDLNVVSDPELFHRDPEENQEVVIIVDPEPDSSLLGLGQNSYLDVDHDFESNWEAELVCENDSSPAGQECCTSSQQPVPEVAVMESDDFCAVCLVGGELLCCDRCPKVYHLACHIPLLISFPLGDWVCTLCRTDQDPVENYECETIHSCGVINAPYSLSNQNQRRCEKLTLLLSCHELSAPFHEPVSPLARNYYQIIKRPIDLSVIRRKLDKCITLHYFTTEQFIDDVLLMFKNCATFNYPDSEVAQAGRELELFFFCKLKEVFPDQTFPAANQDIIDRARLQWLNRKKKETQRKKRHTFSAKQYCL